MQVHSSSLKRCKREPGILWKGSSLETFRKILHQTGMMKTHDDLFCRSLAAILKRLPQNQVAEQKIQYLLLILNMKINEIISHYFFLCKCSSPTNHIPFLRDLNPARELN